MDVAKTTKRYEPPRRRFDTPSGGMEKRITLASFRSPLDHQSLTPQPASQDVVSGGNTQERTPWAAVLHVSGAGASPLGMQPPVGSVSFSCPWPIMQQRCPDELSLPRATTSRSRPLQREHRPTGKLRSAHRGKRPRFRFAMRQQRITSYLPEIMPPLPPRPKITFGCTARSRARHSRAGRATRAHGDRGGQGGGVADSQPRGDASCFEQTGVMTSSYG